jgi:hypothetical protein
LVKQKAEGYVQGGHVEQYEGYFGFGNGKCNICLTKDGEQKLSDMKGSDIYKFEDKSKHAPSKQVILKNGSFG